MPPPGGGPNKPQNKREPTKTDLIPPKKPRGGQANQFGIQTRSNNSSTNTKPNIQPFVFGNQQINITNTNVPVSNQFEILEDDDNMMDDGEAPQRQPTTRRQRAPPIVIVNSNASAVQTVLNELVPSKKFELKLMKVGIRVNILEHNDFQAAHEGLVQKQMNFYTYHTAETRPLKVVLYGLTDTAIDEVKNSLAAINVSPDEIKKLRLSKPLYDKQAVYLLYFKPGTAKISELRKIKHINQLIVRWEKFHPKKYDKIAQCRNCQNLGHSSINCHLPPKCLVCAGDHKTDDCDKKKSRQELELLKKQEATIDRSFVKCALCDQNHTANYLGCSKRKDFIEVQNRRMRPRANKQRAFNVPLDDYQQFPAPPGGHSVNTGQYFSQPGTSYAQVLHEPYNNNPQQDVNLLSTLVSTLQAMMSGMQAMMNKMTDMMAMFVQQMKQSP